MEKNDKNFRNIVDDPYLNRYQGKSNYRVFCGMNAVDDPVVLASEPVPDVPKVKNLQGYNLLKTGLAIVGIIVLAKWAWHKFGK